MLRDGRTVGTNPTSEWTEAQVIARMVGREVGDIFPTIDHEHGDVLLEVRNIRWPIRSLPERSLLTTLAFPSGAVKCWGLPDGRRPQRSFDGNFWRSCW